MPAKQDPAQVKSKRKPKGSPPIRCFTLADCALVSIWLLLMAVVYYAGAALNRTFLDWAVFGGAVLCAANSRWHDAWTAVIAIPFFCLGVLLRMPILSAALLALGCGGVLLLTYRTIRGSRIDRQNLRIGAALPMFVIFIAIANAEIVRFTPHVQDALLLKTDFGISAALRRWTLTYPVLPVIVGVCYEALPLVVVIAIASSAGKDRVQLLWSLCLAALLAVPCYLLLPAAGPVHASQPDAPRNCMPSLHLTWAALLWINERRGWLRRFFLVFTGITAFATLATGEHYVIDLIAAIPFTWAVHRLSVYAARWPASSLWWISPAIRQQDSAGDP
jgi:hypothetical protein